MLPAELCMCVRVCLHVCLCWHVCVCSVNILYVLLCALLMCELGAKVQRDMLLLSSRCDANAPCGYVWFVCATDLFDV